MGRANRMARVKKRTAAMLAGWTKEADRWKGRLSVDGQRLTPQQIIARLSKNQDRHANVDRCRVLLAHAIAMRDRALDQEQRFQENLTVVLRQALGPDLGRLLRYGVGPIKRRGKLSAEKTVIAKHREKETRRARGTLGKRQRKAITAEEKPKVVVQGLDDSPPGQSES
jgi:hypothetical protein